MSGAEIGRLAADHGAALSEAPEPEMSYRVLTVRKGNTAFWLYLSGDRLKKVGRGEYAPPSRLEAGVPEDLCGGRRRQGQRHVRGQPMDRS
jgi:hypothetical protein